MLMADVCGGRLWGSPRIVWMDGLKVALGSRGMTVEGESPGAHAHEDD